MRDSALSFFSPPCVVRAWTDFLALHAIIDYNAINDCMQEENMASLTIRNLDNNVKAQLRQRAARHGRSMEAEARTILSQTLNAPVIEQNLATAIHRRFESLDPESLPIPPRQAVRNPPEFGE
jgi:plasmid stability protein